MTQSNRIVKSNNERQRIYEAPHKEDLADLEASAALAHYGQTRRTGEPYITHPTEVSEIATKLYPGDTLSQYVALLHDTLEDGPSNGTITEEEMLSLIRGSVGDEQDAEEVIEAVRRLTHEPGGDYASYVAGLLDNKLALRVKLCDMLHNLQSSPSEKQKQKYMTALDVLEATANGKPSSVSRLHWKLLQAAVSPSTMSEQVEQAPDGSIKQQLDDFMPQWIRTNMTKVEEELEAVVTFSGEDTQPPHAGQQLTDAFLQDIMDDVGNSEIAVGLAQDQQELISTVQRHMTKIATKLWQTAVQVVKDRNEAPYPEDEHAYYGVSRNDFFT